MPISQLTVLALYGELRNLVLSIERETYAMAAAEKLPGHGGMRTARIESLTRLKAAAMSAEQGAIAVILTDAPAIDINPLTGEAS